VKLGKQKKNKKKTKKQERKQASILILIKIGQKGNINRLK